MTDTKAREPIRRLGATDKEFVQALITLKTTKALAEHFNVSEHTVAMRRSKLRKAGVKIPAVRAKLAVALNTADVEELNQMLAAA